MNKVLEELNPREFAQYLKDNYKFFNLYKEGKYIGIAKYIFGYFAYVEEFDEKMRIVDFSDTSNGGCILYVK